MTAPYRSNGPSAPEILVERGVPYGGGKLLDIYAPRDAGQLPVVLLWHGVGADERDVLEPLARAAAGLGVSVVGSSPLDDLARTAVPPVPFWLVHGTQDPVVDPGSSREFAALLAERGWPVRLEEPPTDHAGVIMAEYDPQLGRARPATSRDAIEAGTLTARTLLAAASGKMAD